MIKLTRAASAELLTNGANIDTNMKSKLSHENSYDK